VKARPLWRTVAEQILLLGLVFSAIAIICDGTWELAAGTFRPWFIRLPDRLQLIGGIGACLSSRSAFASH